MAGAAAILDTTLSKAPHLCCEIVLIAKRMSSFLKHISALADREHPGPVLSKPEHPGVRQPQVVQGWVQHAHRGYRGPAFWRSVRGRHKFQNCVQPHSQGPGQLLWLHFKQPGSLLWVMGRCRGLREELWCRSYSLVFIKLFFIAATALWAEHFQGIVALLRWLITWPLAPCLITQFDTSYNYCMQSFIT